LRRIGALGRAIVGSCRFGLVLPTHGARERARRRSLLVSTHEDGELFNLSDKTRVTKKSGPKSTG
jgi:hypothetical protein